MMIMKYLFVVFYLYFSLFLQGCERSAPAFQMTIDTADKLNGLLLKGVAVSGTVSEGCIAEGTPFVIRRGNEKILEETARILSVSKEGHSKPPNGEAIVKELVTFYLPSVELEKVLVGDVITSSVVSCRETSLAKLK